MKKIPFYIIKSLFFLALLASELMHSQVTPGDGVPPPVGLPIDGGVLLLLVSGALFGVSSLREKKQRS